MPIFRRTNCIITAFAIVTLLQYSTVYRMKADSAEQTVLWRVLALLCRVRSLCKESDDTSCCDNTICPSEDGLVDARNMSMIVI
jgi:hypothetical protein